MQQTCAKLISDCRQGWSLIRSASTDIYLDSTQSGEKEFSKSCGRGGFSVAQQSWKEIKLKLKILILLLTESGSDGSFVTCAIKTIKHCDSFNTRLFTSQKLLEKLPMQKVKKEMCFVKRFWPVQIRPLHLIMVNINQYSVMSSASHNILFYRTDLPLSSVVGFRTARPIRMRVRANPSKFVYS